MRYAKIIKLRSKALQTVVRDLIEEFNQQMPEGLVANLEQGWYL